MANGLDPIADDELLYRRIPATWYDAATGRPTKETFAPNKDRDTSGLSLSRGKYKTAEQAALSNQPGKSYYVAVLRALDVRQAGITIEPRPEPGDPGHCEFPDMRSDNRKASLTIERQLRLVDLCQIQGPFVTPNPPELAAGNG